MGGFSSKKAGDGENGGYILIQEVVLHKNQQNGVRARKIKLFCRTVIIKKTAKGSAK